MTVRRLTAEELAARFPKEVPPPVPEAVLAKYVEPAPGAPATASAATVAGDEFFAPKKARKKSASKKRVLAGLVEEASERIARTAAEGQAAWKDVKPSVLVGAYALAHERVYGVFPSELEREQEFLGACSSAARVVKKLNSIGNAYAMIRWSWERERMRLVAKPEREFRMGWRIQFGDSTVTDFLVELRRRKARKG